MELADAKPVLVVVGNGMLGHRFVEEAIALGVSNIYQIVVLGEERLAAYDRVHLSALFDGATQSDLQLSEPGWYATNNVDLRLGAQASAIDRQARCCT